MNLSELGFTFRSKQFKPGDSGEGNDERMDPNLRAIIAFVATIGGMAIREQSATRQASKLGVPHVLGGLIAAGVAHEL
jgi:hypothetical protein